MRTGRTRPPPRELLLHRIHLPHCTLELDNHRVVWPDRVEALSNTEVDFLLYLIAAEGAVVPVRELLTKVWEYSPSGLLQGF